MDAPPNHKDAPRLNSYASALYEVMDNNASNRVIAGNEYKVWEGKLTETCHSVGIPQGVERRVTKLLEELSSIQILQRGARMYPSVVALLGAPTSETWHHHREKVLTTRPTGAKLALEIAAIKESMGGVDLKGILMNFEERITALEAQSKERNASHKK